MAGKMSILILATHLSLVFAESCQSGYESTDQSCRDENECFIDDYDTGICGENAKCLNTNGSYYCRCEDGYRSSPPRENFTASMSVVCQDINECLEGGVNCGPNAICKNAIPEYSCICENGFFSRGREGFKEGDNIICEDRDECLEYGVCGLNARCHNTIGSYYCVCNTGFRLPSGKANFTDKHEECVEICDIDKTICGNGTCHAEANDHYCACHAGFSNYGNRKSRCTELKCDIFTSQSNLEQILPNASGILNLLNASCVELSESENPANPDAESFMGTLLSLLEEILSHGPLNDNRKVSALLGLMEHALRLLGPIMKQPRTKKYSNHTELEIQLQLSADPPKGPLTLSAKHSQVDLKWETAAGEASVYPGFAAAALLTYKDLINPKSSFLSGMNQRQDEGFRINSRVVTASVSNRDTSLLGENITLTFHHLQQATENNHTCVYWDSTSGNGTWSTAGCTVQLSTANFTVCSCNHLSSFAVLMALYEFEDPFELQLITWFGLSLSLLCLLICILTFMLVRSIHSPRTTIHLHLCISLFVANLIFLAGISSTGNPTGCAVVAGLLHFFYLAAFCWMCLEGIQLFRMVVLVFNTSFKAVYMMAGGYGVPAVIVGISASVNAKGYGTKQHCWLSLENGFIWSFFGPVCIIILVNIFFFLITVWKLAVKFSSLNPDLNNLQKIKAFTITAVAQLCVLGSMWIFGCFQFEKGTIVMSYLFTILNSLQGVLLFLMHCLLSKQVREEYGKCLSILCAPQKKRYSEFTSSQSSKVPTSKSAQHTGESQI